ncbi:hypothetical protein BC827DRAFT_1263709 [Russula dissimulans]|nr:hypothetical protein BC827DRAFT_1263709 [Russula dissimulans]
MSSPFPSPLASPVPVATSAGKKSLARSRAAKPSSTKKAKATTARKPAAEKKSSSKSSPSDHPSWKDIIKEAITQHPEDARSGVSRSAIKKYAEEAYKLDMSSASNLHQLNLALTRGAENETFVFPKGPSGKVKLAPKRPKASADAKENTKPPSKRATSAKKATETVKTAPTKRATTSRTKAPAEKSVKKSAAAPKKAPAVTKKLATVKKPAMTKKATSAKNDAKKTAAKAAATKAKSTTKTARPASAKAKPASASKGGAKRASRKVQVS